MKRCAHCKKLSPEFKCGVNPICSHYYCNQKCASEQWKTHGKFCKSLILIAGSEKRFREEDDTIQIVGQNNITVNVSREKAIAMSATLAAWNNFTQSNSTMYKLDMEFMDLNVLFDLQYFFENNGQLRPVPFERQRFFYIEFCNLLHFLQVDSTQFLSYVQVYKYPRPDFDYFDMSEEQKKIQKEMWEKCAIKYYTQSLERLKAPVIDIEKYLSIQDYGPYDDLNPNLIVQLYDNTLSISKLDVLFSSPYALYHILESRKQKDLFFVLTLIFTSLPDSFLKIYKLNDEGVYDGVRGDLFLDRNALPDTLDELFSRISIQMEDVLILGFGFGDAFSLPEKQNNLRVAQLFMDRLGVYKNDEVSYQYNKEFKTDIKRWVKMFGIEVIEYFVHKKDAWSFILEIEKIK